MNTDMSVSNVIYGLSCSCHPEKGVRYVGQTRRTMRMRLYHHCYAAENWERRNEATDLPVYRWIRKHGKENIRMELLEQPQDPADLDDLEVKWIAALNTFKGGLNVCAGGKSITGYVHTEETKAKMALRVYSEETRAKMSASAKKRSIPELARIRRRELQGVKHHGATATEEEIRDIKEALWNGESVNQVAERCGRTPSYISHISTDRKWWSVPWPIGPRREPPTRELIAAAGRGRTHSQETKKQVAETAKAFYATEEGKAAAAKRARPGSSNSQAIMTEDTVRQMRALHAAGGITYRALGKQFGVTDGAASGICRRKTWKHVE